MGAPGSNATVHLFLTDRHPLLLLYYYLRKVIIYLNHMDDQWKLNFILNSENQASLICNYVSKLLKEINL